MLDKHLKFLIEYKYIIFVFDKLTEMRTVWCSIGIIFSIQSKNLLPNSCHDTNDVGGTDKHTKIVFFLHLRRLQQIKTGIKA